MCPHAGAIQESGGGYTVSFMVLAASCALVALLAMLFIEVPPLKRRCSSRLSGEVQHLQLRSSEDSSLGLSPNSRRASPVP
jgi:hypothetical protein